MAKRKKSKRTSNKSRTKKNNSEQEKRVPSTFWRQVMGFVIGAVLAPLMVLAAFGVGGSLPVGLFNSLKFLLGVSAFIVPVLLVALAVEIFRNEESKVPRSVHMGVAMLLLSLSGFAHLFVDPSQSIIAAENGQGGGYLGHIINSMLLAFLDKITAGIILSAITLISVLFIARIEPSRLLKALVKPLRRSKASEAQGSLAAEANGPQAKSVKFKLNEGVPIQKGSSGVLKKSLGNQEEKEALTTIRDPNWESPPLSLLNSKMDKADPGDVELNADIIKNTLAEFGIEVAMEGANVGPRVTQYTLKPPSGVRLNRITALQDNIALNLEASSIRMEAPIPGKGAVGIEVPNKKAATVRLHSILDSKVWKSSKSPLSFAIGKDIAGDPVVGDLASLPHLLVAGATGSGKSIMLNTLLVSLLYRNSPEDLKLILIDPKQVELAPFNDIPHLLTPVITEADKTVSALKWAIAEMERRFQVVKEAGRRNIAEYNAISKDKDMPYIVLVIDELADIMSRAGRDIENLIVRLAQKSRAVGIHLVLATQRPSVDVITGLIKANVPGRIAFTVSSQVDSRTIIDTAGADQLLGAGDMLYKTPQTRTKRVQGALTELKEVEEITDFLRMQRPPEYNAEIISQPVNLGGRGSATVEGPEDSLFHEAVKIVVESGRASATTLQTRLRIGYARAARILQAMEDQGIIGQQEGNKPREVLISSLDEFEERLNGANTQLESEPSEIEVID